MALAVEGKMHAVPGPVENSLWKKIWDEEKEVDSRKKERERWKNEYTLLLEVITALQRMNWKKVEIHQIYENVEKMKCGKKVQEQPS